MKIRSIMIGSAFAVLLVASPLAQADPPRHAPAWGWRGDDARHRDRWDGRRDRDHRRDWDRGRDRDHRRDWDDRRNYGWRGRAWRHGYRDGYRDHRRDRYGYRPGRYYACGDSGFSIWLDGIGASFYESGRYCN